MSYESDVRLRLITEVLGGQCEGCGTRMLKILNIDHRNGDGKEDRDRFDNNGSRMWQYYLDHQDEAREKLQPLCHNCHDIKSRVAGDYAWRREAESFFADAKEEMKDALMRQVNIVLKICPSLEERRQLFERINLMFNPATIIQATDLGVLYGKPQSVVSKEKQFMEVFKGLSGTENNDVEDKALVAELVKTGKFSDEEANKFIQKFNREGQICERRPGFWCKS